MNTIPLSIATDFAGSGGDPLASLELIAKAGFTHLHWCHQWTGEHFYTDEEIARIARYLRDLGLKLLDIHGTDGGPGGGWFWADDVYRRYGVELVRNRLRMHAMLRGEGTLMMHIPCHRAGDTPERRAFVETQYDALRRSLDEILPMCADLGIPLALENMRGDTFEILERLFAQYPADVLGLCYDSGHGNIVDESGAAHGLEHFEANLDRLLALHLHDNDGSGDQHRPPFYGNVDWPRIVADIRKSPYPRMLSFEMSWNPESGMTKEGFCPDAYARCLRVAKLAD